MRTQFPKQLVVATLVSCIVDLGASAQVPTDGRVNGTGTASIERSADLLRMTIILTAEDKDIAKAMAKLKARKKAALEKLSQLGADETSIDAENPIVGQGDGDLRSLLRRIPFPGRYGEQFNEEVLNSLPKAVSAKLTAEWPLSTTTPEELLIQAHQLETRIKDADLAGEKEPRELTPEQQILKKLERSPEYGWPKKAKPGEPSFVYVAHVSEPDRLAAVAEAFEKARTRAKLLAMAAGMRAAPIPVSLDARWGRPPTDNDESATYRRYMAAMTACDDEIALDWDTEGCSEATGRQPTGVKLEVRVKATFLLKYPSVEGE